MVAHSPYDGSMLRSTNTINLGVTGYASKSLPKACVNYGITELEMTGLLVNMENWKFYLGRKHFDAAVDHRAIPYIMK